MKIILQKNQITQFIKMKYGEKNQLREREIKNGEKSIHDSVFKV